MQGPDEGHHHHPPRLTRAFAAALAALAFAPAAYAAQPHFAALPSPTAPLSQQPPLRGGALSSTERVRHRVDASTTVHVSVDAAGAPFAVTATQRLDVRTTGDYFFTIGAPATAAEATPDSQSSPGLRANGILWVGFVPGHRRLGARITLAPAAVAPLLPLRVERRRGTTLLLNVTGVTVGAYTADALAAPLERYIAQLTDAFAHGRVPASGGAYLTSPPKAVNVHVRAPLEVTGAVGRRRVRTLVLDRLVVPAIGRVRLIVRPASNVDLDVPGATPLDRATRLTLLVARARQYQQFLGNPDPTGRNETTFVYRTATPPPAVAATPVEHQGRSRWATLAIVAAIAAALVGGLVVWARS